MSTSTPQPRPLNVAILPDSFKGSAAAIDVARAMREGTLQAASDVGIEVHVETLPFADGGEGTLDAISSAWGVEPRSVPVTDALGRETTGRYAVSQDATIGVIEAAEANGLPLISDVPFRPLEASTRGVADLVRAALDDGCQEILLCIGGSATTDGAAGMLQALGARLLDHEGQDLAPGGAALRSLHAIDLSDLDPRAREVRWRIACDVTNPLTGDRGAAAIFGPQKGAEPDDVAVLDEGLSVLADVIAAETGEDLRDQPGMGAAGGMPIALVSLLGAEILAGGRLVAETLGADEMLARADLVLTGEGSLDSQSLDGKVVSTVRELTGAQVPVIAIAGSVRLDPARLRGSGITAAFSIASGPQTLDELSQTAVERITATTEQILRVHLHALTAARA